MAAVGVPEAIRRAPLRTVRPQDLSTVYAHPRPQLARLVERGVLVRLAAGYYMATPDTAAPGWTPGIESAALAIGSAIFGTAHAILTGLSAARIHGVIPRALHIATVAVPRQHRPIELDAGGTVRFVKRPVDRLDARLEQLDDLGLGLVTTEEQTALDLAHQAPDTLLSPADLRQTVGALLQRSDREHLAELAGEQRRGPALLRITQDWKL